MIRWIRGLAKAIACCVTQLEVIDVLSNREMTDNGVCV